MVKRTSPCSPPPRAACLRCERGEGLGVGVLLEQISMRFDHHAVSHHATPLPAGERSDREAIRVRGAGFQAFTTICNPLTPTLSPRGRGSPGVACCTIWLNLIKAFTRMSRAFARLSV